MISYRPYPFYIAYIFKKYLRKEYSKAEAKRRWNLTLENYRKLMEKGEDIGGKENRMSSNLYMALAVFAFYDAIDRKITKEELKYYINGFMPKSIPVLSKLADFNKIENQNRLRKRFENYKVLSDQKLAKGEWGNNWRVEINPHNREKGLAFDFTSCPLADFARKNGYMEIMPVLCEFDYQTAALMHAKLIREHTIAVNGDYCDYWYIGDKDTDERESENE